MIKLTCNRAQIDAEFKGTDITILSELCVIVNSVCEELAKDRDNKTLKNSMIKEVANALLSWIKHDEELSK